MKTAVVILNWNGKELLEKFLGNVIKQSLPLADVYVADNGSEDDSLAYVSNNHPEAKIIQNGENLGYAGGYNRALKDIDADIFILLNSDIEVGKNWLKPIIDAFKNIDSLAACQPKILSYHKPDYFEHAGAAGGFIDKYGYPFCKGRIFDHCEKDEGQYDSASEIFWASGACLAIRSDAWKEAGGLDSDFFAHMEEIDLCWRLRNLGYSIMSVPESRVYHIGGGTLPYSSPSKIFYNFRNSLFMLHKNLPSGGFFSTMLKRLILDGIAALKFLVGLNLKAFLQVFRSHMVYYSNIRKLNTKRRGIIKSDGADDNTIYKGSIALQYYLKGRKTFSNIYTEETASSSDAKRPL